jgi:putative flavoprotein involved in K+ transport
MPTTTTVIVGAGQAGLAMSRCLTARSIDHVLLERRDVADSWRTDRWDSLRLLTPNWQSRLPGFRYDGDDPDGFMTMPEVVEFLQRYAKVAAAPVETNTTVSSVRAAEDGYVVTTTEGEWRCRTAVLATGACNLPNVPAVSQAVPTCVTSLTASEYRDPGRLPEGGVLLVGASATGVQLAEEIHRSGRPVTLAVGGHVRMPRVYRGMDIMWWLDGTGILDESYDQVDDIVRARDLPSFQLVGSPGRATLDLNLLQDIGVKLVGRLAGIRDGTAQFSGSLRNQCTLADLKLGRLLDTVDEWATVHGLDAEVGAPERPAPTRVEESPPLLLDLTRGKIRTIIWATGYRPDYSWLHVPVLDSKGRVHHNGGVTAARGLYLLGMPFLRRRKSSLIDGVGDDAKELCAHLAQHLDDIAKQATVALTPVARSPL